ncbi:3-keto-disaccharide hydrolase [Rheinheimera sp.]|uniref:3-keto-disaccharide hydrolase n=1 Tax=Rheinheimera sp. TaxID=1869214 RepID=UPI003AF92AEE
MNRIKGFAQGLGLSLSVALCGSQALAQAEPEWQVLLDGQSGINLLQPSGVANWQLKDGAVQASAGDSDGAFLLSPASYADFELVVEFWASEDANSGVFLRCLDSTLINDKRCYEVNIFDQRPDPSYGTGAIVRVAKALQPMPKAGGHWNRFEISAKGTRLKVVLNGQVTADLDDSEFKQGPLALQWGKGVIKFRKVAIRPL